MAISDQSDSERRQFDSIRGQISERVVFAKLASRERLFFMGIRGLVAIGLVVLAGYCIVTGVGFFSVPHTQAEQIGVDVLGMHLNAGGLGSVIFGSGIVIAFFAGRTAPKAVRTEFRGFDEAGNPSEFNGNA
jgi:hypothetical protein